MLTISDIEELKKSLSVKRKESRHISLVPTMGNLHDGHLKLVKEASQISDFVCVSVFVNPLQFGPEEDFSSYPRTLDEDIQKLENTECALLFVPEPNELLLDIKTHTADPFLSSILCGKTRKMKSLFILLDSLFQLYLWIVITNAILGWLVTFNIINSSNRFIYSLIEFSYRLTEPVLRKIRMVLPIIASIDFPPVVLVLGLIFIRNLFFELFAPYLF